MSEGLTLGHATRDSSGTNLSDARIAATSFASTVLPNASSLILRMSS